MTSPSNDLRRAQPWLGMFVEIAAGAGGSAAAIDAAFAELAEIHHLISFHEAQGDASRMNHSVPGTAVEVDGRTVEVLSASIAFSEESGGSFDVPIGTQLAAEALTKVERLAPRCAAEVLARHGAKALAVNRRDVRVLCNTAGPSGVPALLQ